MLLLEVKLDGDVRVSLRLELVIRLMPGICMNCFSSGVAIVFAIVSDWRRVRRVTGNDRVIDRRQVVNRQLIVSEDAEDEDRNSQQHRHHRPLYEGPGSRKELRQLLPLTPL